MTELSDKMRAYEHPRSVELKEAADKFDEFCRGYNSNPQTITAKSFLGCWARTRRLWCEVSGESLV